MQTGHMRMYIIDLRWSLINHHEQLYALAMKAYIAISGRMTFHRYQDVPGLSQDVPHGILQTSSQPLFAGCPRTVPGRPSWDPPDIQSTPVCRMSQDYPRTSRMGSSLANPLCPDSPGMCPTLVGNTGHLSVSRALQRIYEHRTCTNVEAEDLHIPWISAW